MTRLYTLSIRDQSIGETSYGPLDVIATRHSSGDVRASNAVAAAATAGERLIPVRRAKEIAHVGIGNAEAQKAQNLVLYIRSAVSASLRFKNVLPPAHN